MSINRMLHSSLIFHPERPIKTEQGLPASGSGSMLLCFALFRHDLISFAEGVVALSQGQTQFDADDGTPKYVVSIAYRPTGDESMFKTRGTYSVKKVLAGACKSFGLDFD